MRSPSLSCQSSALPSWFPHPSSLLLRSQQRRYLRTGQLPTDLAPSQSLPLIVVQGRAVIVPFEPITGRPQQLEVLTLKCRRLALKAPPPEILKSFSNLEAVWLESFLKFRIWLRSRCKMFPTCHLNLSTYATVPDEARNLKSLYQ